MSRRVLLVGLALVAGTGCSRTLPTETHTQRTVLSTAQEVEKTGGPLVVERATFEPGDVLVATLKQRQLCRNVYVDTVSSREERRTATRWVALDIVAGAAGAGGGGALIAVAPQFSNKSGTDSSGEKTVSARTYVYIGGAVLAGAGLYALIRGLVTASRGGTERSPARVTREARAEGKPPFECGVTDAGPGTIVVDVGDQRIEYPDPVARSNFRVDLRRLAGSLCADVTSLSSRAVVSFVPRRTPGRALPVAELDLSNCVRVTVATKGLRDAKAALEGATSGKELLEVARAHQAAAAMWRELPKDDPQHGPIGQLVAALERDLRERHRGIVAAEVARAIAAIGAGDPTAALAAACPALSLVAAGGADREGAWTAIYGAYVRRLPAGPEGYDHLLRLLRCDPPTRQCAAGGACPDWLTAARIGEVLKPTLAAAATAATRGAPALVRASAALKRTTSLKTIQEVERALAGVAAARGRCAPLAVAAPPLQERCKELLDAVAAAEGVVAERAAKIDEIKRAHAEAQRKQRVRKAAGAWRAHFGRCKRLREGVDQLNQVRARGECGKECEAVIKRMQAEEERLASFRVEGGVEDAQVLQKLREECGAAACRVCP